MASMVFHHKHMDMSEAFKIMEIPEVNLKMIPDSQGNPEIAQLLQVKFEGIKIKSAWEGPARIYSIPHVVSFLI
jgi:acetoacetate decarboxylase